MANRASLVQLPAFLEESLVAGHPWVYRDHVPAGFRAKTGDWVLVRAGKFRGVGLWDDASPIALRMLAGQDVPDADWVLARVREAWELRAPLRDAGVTAYRWIAGEGDGLPGIVVDRYDAYAVIVTYADAVERLVPWVTEALRATAPLSGIVVRQRQRESNERLRIQWGQTPPREVVVEEYGVRLGADLHAGQKTGLFLDHRENRRHVGRLALRRRVLNLFAYTGAFSLHAARGGAREVVSVDVAPGAIDGLRRNLELNALPVHQHQLVVADVFDYLERASTERQRFDLVISDPPSFAKTRAKARQAYRAYVRLTAAGLRVAAPLGLYVGASCTSQVGPDAFRQALAEGARKARCRLQIIHEAGQPLDHPVMAHHPEGRYLKFVVARVLPR